MKKKILAIMLAVVLVLLTACSGGADSGVKTFGSTDSTDPLRICVDLQYSESQDESKYNSIMQDLAYALESTLGMENVVIEYLPPANAVDFGLHQDNLAVRSTAIDRVRVEIMSGGGPDLFLMSYTAYSYGTEGLDIDTIDALFKYPEKAMANGLFLPLDDYIENHAEYAEWDNFTEGVMAAGRNEEGQQIIPMAYTMPILVLPKTEFDYTLTRELTWDDMLHDPELSPYALDLANCSVTYNDPEPLYDGRYLPYVLGPLVDYEEEKLLFTEEELLQCVKEILALEQKDAFEEIYGAKEFSPGTKITTGLSQEGFNKPVTMLPMYSVDGGVTAQITSYAAINRNTKKPEEAFRVLDYLMSQSMHQNSGIHRELIGTWVNLPMDEELMRDEEHWLFNQDKYMIEENYQELCEVRDQIKGANFDGELTTLLSDILSTCVLADYYGKTVEEIVHEAYVNMERRVRE